MPKARKIMIGGIVIAVAGVYLCLCPPSQQTKLDALVLGARQAVLDISQEYATARNFKPAYHGYVLSGKFDFTEIRSRIGDVGVPVLSMDQVHAVDWRKENSNARGWGPQYVYRRNDTGQDAFVLTMTLARCWQYRAKVQIDHDSGGATYTLSRWPGQPWRITYAEFQRIVY